ncbi:hypothetical protein N665_1514s0005 [Sinapis alba]|nr:hypothetical protein N665_1514s0005 [Sinapis alba]
MTEDRSNGAVHSVFMPSKLSLHIPLRPRRSFHALIIIYCPHIYNATRICTLRM